MVLDMTLTSPWKRKATISWDWGKSFQQAHNSPCTTESQHYNLKIIVSPKWINGGGGGSRVRVQAEAMVSDSQESGDGLGVSRGTIVRMSSHRRGTPPLLSFLPTPPRTLPASQAWCQDSFIQRVKWWWHRTFSPDWCLSKNFIFKEMQTLGIPVEHSIWLLFC